MEKRFEDEILTTSVEPEKPTRVQNRTANSSASPRNTPGVKSYNTPGVGELARRLPRCPFTQIISWGLTLLIFLLPLFFLPITPDLFNFPKNILLISFTALLLIIWTIKIFVTRELKVICTPFDLPILLFGLASVLATIFAAPNKIEALLVPGETGTVLALVGLYFLITNSLHPAGESPRNTPGVKSSNTPGVGELEIPRTNLLTALKLSGALLSLFTLYQFLGVGQTLAPWPFLQDPTFTPAGNLFILATFLAVLTPLTLTQTYQSFKSGNRHPEGAPATEGSPAESRRGSFANAQDDEVDQRGSVTHDASVGAQDDEGKGTQSLSRTRFGDDEVARNGGLLSKALNLILSLLILTGLGLCLGQLFRTAKPTLLPFYTAWAIAIESFKNSPLFGVGPANFINAFTLFKPAEFNLTPLWSLNFFSSSNYFLHLLTTVGLFGLGAWLFLVWRAVLAHFNARQSQERELKFAITIIVASLLFLPLNLLLLTTFFLLLACLAPNYLQAKKIPLAPTLAVILLGLSGAALYFSTRALAAEITYQKALTAISQNQGGQAYNLLIQARQLNPYRPAYRLTYSQVNLGLANSFASKEDPTDEDRQKIIQLIKQSIREAKIAINLNPSSSSAWENLAQIYRQLINLAQDADQWSLAAYQRAIILHPRQPRLRVDFGGLYYALGLYESATDQFKIAVSLKPDYANAWYNLAAAYRQQEKINEAAAALQKVVSLLAEDNPDRQKAQTELEDLQAAVSPPIPQASPSVEATPSSELESLTLQEKLATPSALPSPEIGPFYLPQDLGLPQESTPAGETPPPSSAQ